MFFDVPPVAPAVSDKFSPNCNFAAAGVDLDTEIVAIFNQEVTQPKYDQAASSYDQPASSQQNPPPAPTLRGRSRNDNIPSDAKDLTPLPPALKSNAGGMLYNVTYKSQSPL